MQIPWGAIVALIIYIVGSTVGFIWWMATITITLQFMKESLEKANKLLDSHELTYVKKVEMVERLAIIDRAVEKCWDEVDKLRDKKQ